MDCAAWQYSTMGIFFLIFLFVCHFLFSCAPHKQRGGILTYEKNKVNTASGKFQVGALPEGWQKPKIHHQQLLYENDIFQATIVTDAHCGRQFVDSPLPRLARDLFDRMDHIKINSQKNMTVDGREAFYLQGSGNVDGIALKMSTVVMKKNFCLYDFVYFAPPETFAQGEKDFVSYVRSMRTHQ